MARPLRGISFIDVIVGSALILIIFLALFTLLRANVLVSSIGKAKAAATTLANNQLEYIRTLSYDNIGTTGGIPSGIIPETATSTENGITYVTRTFIQYVDDPADGSGASDVNGIITDYKRIKIAVSYTAGGKARDIELVTNHAPVGIETTVGGGTLRVVVVNAAGTAVSGATVDITNPSVSPSVDLTAFTDATGVVLLPGAATSTDYRVTVTKNGYSQSQTYARDATNQNPTPGYLTVVENQTTTGTFAIDTLATFTIRSFSPIEPDLFADTFTDSTNLASQSNVTVSGGVLQLGPGTGGYAESGIAYSRTITPDMLAGWGSASSTVTTPAGTSVRVFVTDETDTLVPDEMIPGNSAGFTDSVIDLSSVATSTYPSLALRAELSTADPLVTPTVQEWGIGYTTGPLPLPNVSFSLLGSKTTGSTGGGAPIYKTDVDDTTGSGSSKTLSLEWDIYEFSVASYDIADACLPPPYTLAPGSATDVSLYLVAPTTHSLLVSVRDSAGAVVTDATVTVARTGFSDSEESSSCGASYFGGLTAGTYSITISKSGYTTVVFTNVDVSGRTLYAASFE
jgi:hypothetical protein